MRKETEIKDCKSAQNLPGLLYRFIFKSMPHTEVIIRLLTWSFFIAILWKISLMDLLLCRHSLCTSVTLNCLGSLSCYAIFLQSLVYSWKSSKKPEDNAKHHAKIQESYIFLYQYIYIHLYIYTPMIDHFFASLFHLSLIKGILD